jgi:hypothetical protein
MTMSTDRLLDTLVAGLRPVRSRRPVIDGLIVAGLAAVEFMLYALLGPGLHVHQSMHFMPSFVWKIASLGTFSAVSLIVALRSFDPAWSPRRGLALLTGIFVVVLLAGWIVDAMTTTVAPPMMQRLDPHDGMTCTLSVIALSIPPTAALGWLMRRGAPTDLRGSALSVGLAGAALGALLFAFACPHHDPLYIAVWFTLGCGIVALAGRLLLPLINRW